MLTFLRFVSFLRSLRFCMFGSSTCPSVVQAKYNCVSVKAKSKGTCKWVCVSVKAKSKGTCKWNCVSVKVEGKGTCVSGKVKACASVKAKSKGTCVSVK